MFSRRTDQVGDTANGIWKKYLPLRYIQYTSINILRQVEKDCTIFIFISQVQLFTGIFHIMQRNMLTRVCFELGNIVFLVHLSD